MSLILAYLKLCLKKEKFKAVLSDEDTILISVEDENGWSEWDYSIKIKSLELFHRETLVYKGGEVEEFLKFFK